MPKNSPSDDDKSKKPRTMRAPVKTTKPKKVVAPKKSVSTSEVSPASDDAVTMSMSPAQTSSPMMKESSMNPDSETSSDVDSPDESSGKRNLLWIILTIVCALVLGMYMLYEYQPDVHARMQNLFSKSSFSQTKTFELPITVVYDSSEPTGTKSLKEQFFKSLLDPQKGLKNTVLKDTWINPDSEEGKKIITETDAKYLPIVFLNTSIEQHPQFQDLKNYLEKKGDFYYFHVTPLKHLKVPSLEGGHLKGADPAKAQVVILEYASYTCPFCNEMQEPLEKAMKEFSGKISLVYKHFDRKPFNGTPVDNLLAQAAECANEQDKFWAMHDELFKDQSGFIKHMQTAGKITVEEAVRKYLEGKPKITGLNSKKFLECYDSKKYLKTPDTTTMEALQYGVNGTPAFFINGKFYDGSFRDEKGVVSYEKLKAAIDLALKGDIVK